MPKPSNFLLDYLIKSNQGLVYYYDIDLKSFTQTLTNIENAIGQARKAGITPSSIFVNNPNDLTGQLFTRKELSHLVDLTFANNLMILAEESS